MKKLLLIFCFGLMAQTPAFANKEVNNGGDTCEERFQSIRDDVATWIKGGGGRDLTFPVGVTPSIYETRMRSAIDAAKFSCQEAPILVDGAEKTCRNFLNANGVPEIHCNFKRFKATGEAEQYLLVHHEYAGVAGLETNDGSASNYAISSQLSNYLVRETVKRLALKKAPPSESIDLRAHFGAFLGRYRIESCLQPRPGRHDVCYGHTEAELKIYPMEDGSHVLTIDLPLAPEFPQDQSYVGSITIAGDQPKPGDACSTFSGTQYCEAEYGTTHLRIRELDGKVYLDYTSVSPNRSQGIRLISYSFVLAR